MERSRRGWERFLPEYQCEFGTMTLRAGTIGTVIAALGGGYLVGFGSRGPDRCDWFDVLDACDVWRAPGRDIFYISPWNRLRVGGN